MRITGGKQQAKKLKRFSLLKGNGFVHLWQSTGRFGHFYEFKKITKVLDVITI